MHELALAENVVEILNEEADRHGLSRIEKIYLKIGTLRGIVPDIFVSCIQIASRETRAENMQVETEVVQAQAKCPNCNHIYPIEALVFFCPQCERLGGEIIAGEEFQIIHIEGE